MLFRKKDKPRERFYLFPGQGGRNYRRKQRYIMRWTIAAAVVCGLAAAVVIWWQAHPNP